MDCRKIDLLLLKRFIEGQQVIGNIPGAMSRRDNQPDPLRLQIFEQRSVQDSRAVTSLFQLFARCSDTYSALPSVLPLIRVISAMIARSTIQSGVLYAVSELGSTCGKMWD